MSELPDFTGDPEGYLAWREANPQPFNWMWCVRHWMPCPVEGRSGILASVLLAGESYAFLPDDVTLPSAIQSWWENQTESACCKFGDDKMNHLWAMIKAIEEERTCGSLPWAGDKKAKGRHACFYPKDHRGVHDWQEKIKSIFNYEVPE